MSGIGEDRLIDILPKSFRESIQRDPAVFVVGVGEVEAEEVLGVAEELRSEGYRVISEMSGRSMKAALKRADRAEARWAVLIGEDDLSKGAVTVRNLEKGEQKSVARAEIAMTIRGEE